MSYCICAHIAHASMHYSSKKKKTIIMGFYVITSFLNAVVPMNRAMYIVQDLSTQTWAHLCVYIYYKCQSVLMLLTHKFTSLIKEIPCHFASQYLAHFIFQKKIHTSLLHPSSNHWAIVYIIYIESY